MNCFIYRGLFIFGGLALLGGCQKSDSGPVIARVGGQEITQGDVVARLQDTPAAYQQYLASPDGRKQFLNLMVREKVLYVEARRSGLQQEPAYKEAIKQFEARMQQRLKDYKESLLVDSYIRRLRSKDLAVSDADVRRFYEEHRADFDRPMEIEASHILVSSEDEAKLALKRLKAGEPFEKVAKEMSQDPATAVRGGRLKPFVRGMLVPEFEEAAAKLKVGETSGIVKTQFGFHIIRKLGQRQLPAQPFDQIKEQVRARLEREKFDQWVTKRQEAMGVKIDEKAMSALQNLQSGPPPQEPPQP